MATQSVSDWTYQVSQHVGAFAISGMIGFAAAKALKLWGDRLQSIPWSKASRVFAYVLAPVAMLAAAPSVVAGDRDALLVVVAIPFAVGLLAKALRLEEERQRERKSDAP